MTRIPKPPAPIVFAVHHRVGTVLLTKVLGQIAEDFGWAFGKQRGRATMLGDTRPDLLLLSHGLTGYVEHEPVFNEVGAWIHLVRDPAAVIESGFHYHRRGSEPWCLADPSLSPDDPTYPYVPHVREHMPLAWRRSYIQGLKGKSYAENLIDRTVAEGLTFEMERYAAWTVSDMDQFARLIPESTQVKFEDFEGQFQNTFETIFQAAGFSERATRSAVRISNRHDLRRRTWFNLGPDPHSTTPGRRAQGQLVRETVPQLLESMFGAHSENLGYAKADA